MKIVYSEKPKKRMEDLFSNENLGKLFECTNNEEFGDCIYMPIKDNSGLYNLLCLNTGTIVSSQYAVLFCFEEVNGTLVME